MYFGVFSDLDTYNSDCYLAPHEEHEMPFTYLGFGVGMHSCIGKNFAFLQVRTILSILLQKYKIEIARDYFSSLDFKAMVVGPKGDYQV